MQRKLLPFFVLSSLLLLTAFSQLVHKQHDMQLENLLLVVGDVQQTTARILYENMNSKDTITLHVTLFKQDPSTKSFSIVNTDTVSAKRRPQTIHFSNLHQNSFYLVSFSASPPSETETAADLETLSKQFADFVTFQTASSSLTEKKKIIVVSCNRFYEDKDSVLIQQLVQDEKDRFGTVHLGDQVYADWVANYYIQQKKKLREQREEKNKRSPSTPPAAAPTTTVVTEDDAEIIREGFRQVYRVTWGNTWMQKLLRHGANWMLPDDHDIVNNLDSWMQLPEAVSKAIIDQGRLVFYEYQGALSDNFLSVEDVQSDKMKRDEMFFVRKLFNSCFFFLDTRFQRTFQFTEESPLFGTRQYEFISKQLEECSKQGAKSLTFFTSIPMLFIPEILAKLVYKVEKEKYTTHPDLQADTVKLFELLAAYNRTNKDVDIHFVGGDLHQYFFAQICKRAGASPSTADVCFSQLATSGLTKGSTIAGELKLFFFHFINRYLTPPVGIDRWYLARRSNEESLPMQQYIGRNYGVIELSPNSKPVLSGVAVKDETTKEQVLNYLFDASHLLACLGTLVGILVLRRIASRFIEF